MLIAALSCFASSLPGLRVQPEPLARHTPQREADPVTVFMGVPTMYSHLLTWRDMHMDSQQQAAAAAAARRVREGWCLGCGHGKGQAELQAALGRGSRRRQQVCEPSGAGCTGTGQPCRRPTAMDTRLAGMGWLAAHLSR